MTIEVTGCHDCPFAIFDSRNFEQYCRNPMSKEVINVSDCAFYQEPCPEFCPLQTEEITIKKKYNDNTRV
jgi:hypothetical protein